MTDSIGLIFPLIAGFILLLAGRRFFWLFAGLLGFIAGFRLAAALLGDQSGLTPLLIALASGGVGCVLVVKLQKVAIAVIGFLAGGLLLSMLVQLFFPQIPGVAPWLVGGVAGLILFRFLFNWTLILFSAAIGSAMLTQAIPYLNGFLLAKFLILFIIGILVQTLQGSGRRRRG